MTRDITERRKGEEEQALLETKVQHAKKLESLGDLAGGIAHDFNNILLAMIGYLRFALDKVDAKALYVHFPKGPAKQAGKIAGLPETKRKGGY